MCRWRVYPRCQATLKLLYTPNKETMTAPLRPTWDTKAMEVKGRQESCNRRWTGLILRQMVGASYCLQDSAGRTRQARARNRAMQHSSQRDDDGLQEGLNG